MRRAILALPLVLSGCGGLLTSEGVTGACQHYQKIAAVAKLAVILHPGLGVAIGAITAQVDPICAGIMAGQAAPIGVSEGWILNKATELEQLER